MQREVWKLWYTNPRTKISIPLFFQHSILFHHALLLEEIFSLYAKPRCYRIVNYFSTVSPTLLWQSRVSVWTAQGPPARICTAREINHEYLQPSSWSPYNICSCIVTWLACWRAIQSIVQNHSALTQSILRLGSTIQRISKLVEFFFFLKCA